MAHHTEKSYQERLNRVLVHIQENLDEPLSLDDLAAVAHFSPFHFHRMFSGMVGESVKEYVRRLRLERAAAKLRFSSLAVTDISAMAGFDSQSAFTRAFKTMFSMTPSVYRKLCSGEKPGPTRTCNSQCCAPLGAWATPSGESLLTPEIQTIAPIRVAFVRHIGPYMECKPAWEKLCAWATLRGVLGPDTLFIGVSHDDPEVTPPEKLRYDACITVSPDVGPDGRVGVQTVGGGEYATAVHKGPYQGLFGAYAWLCGQWIPAQKREIGTSPTFEHFLNCPDTTPSEELRTRIHVPLEPK
ncbi:MAG: GyrI-like domain-containing protein [Desulfovibrionaceae bacterium]